MLQSLPWSFPTLKQTWVDMSHHGRLLNWTFGPTLTVVKRPVAGPVRSIPNPSRRWVVERISASLGHNRRLSEDYEQLLATEGAWIYAAMTQLMIRRFAQ